MNIKRLIAWIEQHGNRAVYNGRHLQVYSSVYDSKTGVTSEVCEHIKPTIAEARFLLGY